jgi:hypothetical protein
VSRRSNELAFNIASAFRAVPNGGTARYFAFLAAALLVLINSSLARAGSIPVGPLMGNTVIYDHITEATSDPVNHPLPLFGPPTVTGDSIDFNPIGFSAHASGAGGVDLVDSNLGFTVQAKQVANPILKIQFSEAGDTTLSGFGTNATFTSVTADGVIDIYEVDGVGVNTVNIPFSLTFTPFGGTYGLGSHGGGPIYHTAWSGGGLFDLTAALANAHVPYVGGATKISVDLDNTLVALSEAGTLSLIAKKDFGGISVTINPLGGGGPGPDTPEPTSLVLATLGMVGFLAGRRMGGI